MYMYIYMCNEIKLYNEFTDILTVLIKINKSVIKCKLKAAYIQIVTLIIEIW